MPRISRLIRVANTFRYLLVCERYMPVIVLSSLGYKKGRSCKLYVIKIIFTVPYLAATYANKAMLLL